MTALNDFDYDKAFSRNIGWVTQWEQQILRTKKIAIAGIGGVGGIHLLTLARLGFENFNIADPDTFELANFNRQVGAFVSTIGKSKTEVLNKIACDINPGIKITEFPKGISHEEINTFLKDIDLYIDGLDFYVLEIRRKIFRRCRELGIAAITAAPLGMGTSYLTFLPDGMSFDEYFGFNEDAQNNQLKFLVGLNPSAKHTQYLVDRTKVNLKERRAPSMMIACNFAAGVVATEAIKILLKRGKLFSAPWYQAFDPYLNTFTRGYVSGGSKNWMQKLRYKAMRLFLSKGLETNNSAALTQTPKKDIEKILDLAKWTPSGDNSQPWKFELKNDSEVWVHIRNEASTYDFNGKPSLLTIGSFIESFRIAASQFNYRLAWNYQPVDATTHIVKLNIEHDPNIKKDPLFSLLKIRSVCRYPYQTRPLTQQQKLTLENCVSPLLTIHWYETLAERWAFSKITGLSTNIRLSIPETYPTHKKIIDFKNDYSTDRVPVKAIGVSTPTQQLMGFQLKSWNRVNFMNTFLGAAIVPQIEMDFIPGLCSGGFYILEWGNPSDSSKTENILHAGQLLQRFWLQLTQLGLVMQPAIGCLSLAYYGKNKVAFTKQAAQQKMAQNLAAQIDRYVDVNNIFFMGRIGVPRTFQQQPRSIRKELSELIIS